MIHEYFTMRKTGKPIFKEGMQAGIGMNNKKLFCLMNV